jgi:bzd-type benzoyl-CoA reductase N subunit
MTTLAELAELPKSVDSPAIRQWKKEGRKVVGFFCAHVPEEILYAADLLPYRFRAPDCAETTSADRYMGHVNCTYTRACLEFIYQGKYDFLDGLVFTNSCDHTRRLYDVIRETKPYPFMHLLSVPHKVSGEDVALFYRDEFNRLKEAVEKTFEVEVTEDKLREAIEVYNEGRRLLRELYELRKGPKPPLTGAEVLNVVLAAGLMPRDQYNGLLKKLLEELKGREGPSDHRARLMISGSGGCDDSAYLQVIEDLGGLIVTDSLCLGSRYFWQPIEIEEDLMLGLAKSYLKQPACANMTDQVAGRVEYIKQMAKDFEVGGVIFQRMRYCDLWGGQLLYIADQLKESQIPMLSLEREYTSGGEGQLQTRVQAFLESME